MENRDFSESHWSAATAATVAYTIYHKIRLDTQATETKIKTTESKLSTSTNRVLSSYYNLAVHFRSFKMSRKT